MEPILLYSAGMSLFPSLAGSSLGDSVASRSVFLLPTITETEGTNVIVSGDVLEEPCSSRQADVRLSRGTEGSEEPGTDSLKLCSRLGRFRKEEEVAFMQVVKGRSVEPVVAQW